MTVNDAVKRSKELEIENGGDPTPLSKSLRLSVVPKAFEPLGTMVALHIFKATDVSCKSGIIIPDASQDNWETPVAAVVAVGSECKLGLKEGDRVLVEHRQNGWQIRYNGNHYVMVDEKQIAGKL